ncbi:transposase [Arcobacter sp.]|uniref:transposase n=1 Tax=unclassified Arcobacter TaxID=2593671 RepID=UPI003B00AD06
MPRRERITDAGCYHVVCRGVERRNVFLDSDDFEQFLALLKSVKKEFDIIVHSFCLMTNHYHILLETKEDNISLAMKYLNSHYAIYFNKKYKRTGHLWQGRFHSDYLYADNHFWYVAKYIEQNPIKAKMVKEIHHYKYQSFFQWKYQCEYSYLLEGSKIFDMTLLEYQNYISSDMDSDILDIIYTTPKIINKNGEIKILYKRLNTFFHEDKSINRNNNIKKAYEYGYTKSEIANFLALSSTAISKILD